MRLAQFAQFTLEGDFQMAHRVMTELVDDLDNSVADETVTFGLDGVQYEIDLNMVNAKQLRNTLAPYTDHARRVAGRVKRAKVKSAAPAVRAWAQGQNISVPTRGRVPTSVQDAYNRAHG